mmetsp:Transcript_12174/g.36707  ORF Transcript_12174/g.36707 Transcript_12174/m.36707 type:complete len:293 (+) Transcript_12174:623-1501(+)
MVSMVATAGPSPHDSRRSSGTRSPTVPRASGRTSLEATCLPTRQPSGPPHVPSAPGTAQDLQNSSTKPSQRDGSTETLLMPAAHATKAAVSKQRWKGEVNTWESGASPSSPTTCRILRPRDSAWRRPRGVSGGSQGRSAVGTQGIPVCSHWASSKRSPWRTSRMAVGLAPLGAGGASPGPADARTHASPSLQTSLPSTVRETRSSPQPLREEERLPPASSRQQLAKPPRQRIAPPLIAAASRPSPATQSPSRSSVPGYSPPVAAGMRSSELRSASWRSPPPQADCRAEAISS